MNASKETGMLVPQNFWEWLMSVYPPDKFTYQYREFVVTLAATPAAPGADTIKIDETYFAFELRSAAWVTATGAAPAVPYRLKVSQKGEQWTGENGVTAGILTGDALGNLVARRWDWPREVYREDVISVRMTNDIVVGAAGITGDVALCGYQVRRRSGDTEVQRAARE